MNFSILGEVLRESNVQLDDEGIKIVKMQQNRDKKDILTFECQATSTKQLTKAEDDFTIEDYSQSIIEKQQKLIDESQPYYNELQKTKLENFVQQQQQTKVKTDKYKINYDLKQQKQKTNHNQELSLKDLKTFEWASNLIIPQITEQEAQKDTLTATKNHQSRFVKSIFNEQQENNKELKNVDLPEYIQATRLHYKLVPKKKEYKQYIYDQNTIYMSQQQTIPDDVKQQILQQEQQEQQAKEEKSKNSREEYQKLYNDIKQKQKQRKEGQKYVAPQMQQVKDMQQQLKISSSSYNQQNNEIIQQNKNKSNNVEIKQYTQEKQNNEAQNQTLHQKQQTETENQEMKQNDNEQQKEINQQKEEMKTEQEKKQKEINLQKQKDLEIKKQKLEELELQQLRTNVKLEANKIVAQLRTRIEHNNQLLEQSQLNEKHYANQKALDCVQQAQIKIKNIEQQFFNNTGIHSYQQQLIIDEHLIKVNNHLLDRLIDLYSIQIKKIDFKDTVTNQIVLAIQTNKELLKQQIKNQELNIKNVQYQEQQQNQTQVLKANKLTQDKDIQMQMKMLLNAKPQKEDNLLLSTTNKQTQQMQQVASQNNVMYFLNDNIVYIYINQVEYQCKYNKQNITRLENNKIQLRCKNVLDQLYLITIDDNKKLFKNF